MNIYLVRYKILQRAERNGENVVLFKKEVENLF